MAELLDCGHPELPHSEITRGYGTDAEGKTRCYKCCETNDRMAMLNQDSILAYVDSAGHKVTAWPGWTLGRVTLLSRREGTRDQWGEYRYTVRCVDGWGQKWYGVGGGEGMYVSLRKYKGQTPHRTWCPPA